MTLFWDLDAGNHEITLLKIKHLRLKERYGEGEIPYEAKTGSGPILLTFSFPYVRDWLNEHPFKNSPDSRVICNLITGAPIRPDAEDSVERKDIRLSITGYPTTRLTRNYSIFPAEIVLTISLYTTMNGMIKSDIDVKIVVL
ncbi:MAG: hypothetical protein WA421_11855 [Nitrososphaeraceae archaeon]